MAQQRPAVLKHKRTTLERAEKFISKIYFSDVNLQSCLYPATVPITRVEHYAAPGRISYENAVRGQYAPCAVGQSFGPTWSTHWFRLSVNIDADWIGKEVHLSWNSDSEALLWKNGQPVQGFSGDRRTDYIISLHLKENELDQQYFVEMACNGLFGAGKNGTINPPDENKTYTLKQLDVRLVDSRVQQLILDTELLIDIVKNLSETNRSYQALYAVNEIVNLCQRDKKEYNKALHVAAKFFGAKNGESQHTLLAMGHCHIDTAWLWPYAETIRKCARSWTNAVHLMERFPEFKFVCSQAQQYEWVKEKYPDLFASIKKWVKRGQFIPAGGCWVEMDGNMPSGESFIRQILFGQKFFMKEFDKRCREVWLPDTFGYSAQLPQILNHMGIKRFLTQKISWNLVNKFPHHTFYWCGIDGSEVLVHFPPGDSYCMEVKVNELKKSIDNFRDKGRSNHSAFLFGYGDGGQGPTDSMLMRLERLKDCDGLPKMESSSPEHFFDVLENEDGNNYCKWVGELYLELHNGTYTTQAQIKRQNRLCEFRLHDAEFLSCVAFAQTTRAHEYHKSVGTDLITAWKYLLLNQFHDVLPGSCTNEVSKDALNYYAKVHNICDRVIGDSVEKLFPSPDKELTGTIVLNTLGWPRCDVIVAPPEQPIGSLVGKKKLRVDSTVCETAANGNKLLFVRTPSYGYSTLDVAIAQPSAPVVITRQVCEEEERICMENGMLRAVIDSHGRIVSLQRKDGASLTKSLVRESAPSNQFVLYDDIPLYWDAWDVMDYHMETRAIVDELIQPVVILDNTLLRVSVQFRLKISDNSSLKQTITLDADSPCLKFDTEVDWNESHKFLKVEFPVEVLAERATYEIQFGHLQRPTHYNTSWDQAKFEVCSHKWADLAQHDLGLALLNDSKYGISTRDNIMRLSLLRSSRAPDDTADIGCQRFAYALLPHSGTFQSSGVIKQAYMLNCPVLLRDVAMTTSTPVSQTYFALNNESVVLETIKMSEDRTDVIVLRLYESFGGNADVTITSSFTIKDAWISNGMEEVWQDSPRALTRHGLLQLSFRPFQVQTLLLQI